MTEFKAVGIKRTLFQRYSVGCFQMRALLVDDIEIKPEIMLHKESMVRIYIKQTDAATASVH